MSMIIIFFIGLILLFSGDEISLLTNFLYAELICDVLGGLLMGYGALLYCRQRDTIENEREKRVYEIKQLTGHLVGKDEYAQGFEVVKEIATVLNEDRAILDSIVSNQTQLIQFNQNMAVDKTTLYEMKDKISTEMLSVKDFLAENRKLYDRLSEGVDKLENIKELVDKCQKNEFKIASMLEEKSNNLEVFVQTEAEKMRVVTSENAQLIQSEVKNSKEEVTKIVERMNRIDSIPVLVSNSMEEMIAHLNTFMDELLRNMEQLEEDLEEHEGKRTKKFNLVMDEIQKDTAERNEEISEHIKELADQYKQFEKTISAIVQQMTELAQDDIKIMKGFLNG